MVLRLAFVFSLLPGLAPAETLSLDRFEALVTGRTLTFQHDGRAYGAEEYRENRQVVRSFLDGDCLEGRYFERDGQICFVYDAYEGAQCWEFSLENGQLTGIFEGDPGNTVLLESARSREPLICPGPDLGV